MKLGKAFRRLRENILDEACRRLRENDPTLTELSLYHKNGSTLV